MSDIVKKNSDSLIKAKMGVLKLAVGNNEKKLSKVMGDIKSMLTSPNLAKCSKDSIINSAISLVKLDLDIDPLIGEAYVTPYGNIATPQIGYKGYIKIASRAGWRVIVTPIYKGEHFVFEEVNGSKFFKHRANIIGNRESDKKWVEENLQAMVVTAIDPKGFKYIEAVGKDMLEKLKNSSKMKSSSIWDNWTIKMYKAKAIKYILKTIPISSDMSEALKVDDEGDTIKSNTEQDIQDVDFTDLKGDINE